MSVHQDLERGLLQMRLATPAVCSLKIACWANNACLVLTKFLIFSLSGTLSFLSILPNTIATFSYQIKNMKQKENTVDFHFVVTDAVYIFRACVVIFGKGENP